MNTKQKQQKITPTNNDKNSTFKPQINENSNKLSEEFRRKILSDLNSSEENLKKEKNQWNLMNAYPVRACMRHIFGQEEYMKIHQ